MGSIVAFFHKHYSIQERKFRATNQMKKSIKRIQTTSNWRKCDKCGEYLKKKDLRQDDLSKESLCSNCTDALRILRDV